MYVVGYIRIWHLLKSAKKSDNLAMSLLRIDVVKAKVSPFRGIRLLRTQKMWSGTSFEIFSIQFVSVGPFRNAALLHAIEACSNLCALFLKELALGFRAV